MQCLTKMYPTISLLIWSRVTAALLGFIVGTHCTQKARGKIFSSRMTGQLSEPKVGCNFKCVLRADTESWYIKVETGLS